MKRAILSALGLGLAMTLAGSPTDAQSVRVAVGVRVPHVGVRVDYRPRRAYPVRRVYRPAPRRLVYERELQRRMERERYRAWLAYEYRRWLRQHHRAQYIAQREWERQYLRDQRRAERDYRKWLRDREKDRRRGRGPRGR